MHEKKLDKLLSGPQFFFAYAFAKNQKLSIIKLSPIDEQVFLDMFAWKDYPDSQHFSYLEEKIRVLFCGMMFLC
jgi:hypothetical protein